jgi:cytochrome c oxidase subunit 4
MNLAADSKIYLRTTAALLGLLALTIGAAYVDLGPFNTIVAMSISVAKGLLIVLFFMHVRGSGRLIWIAAATGFFWLGIMLVLAMSDFATRGWK